MNPQSSGGEPPDDDEDLWDIEIARSARRGLNDLPERVRDAVLVFAHGPLRRNPKRVGKPLRDPLQGLHSARRSEFRIIYEIDEESHRVVIVAFEPRDDVYAVRGLRRRRRWTP